MLSVGPDRVREQTAIHPDCLAGDEFGGVAGQERDRFGDVERLSDAAERSELGPRAGVVAGLLLGALDFNRAGGYAVYGDVVPAQLYGRHLGEHLDAAFAGSVVGQ